jgi:hypothetical protein
MGTKVLTSARRHLKHTVSAGIQCLFQVTHILPDDMSEGLLSQMKA